MTGSSAEEYLIYFLALLQKSTLYNDWLFCGRVSDILTGSSAEEYFI